MLVEASLLYLAAASAWLRRLWPVTAGLLAAAYAWGLASGFLGPAGLVAGAAIMALMALALLCGRTPDGARGLVLHGAFLVLALLLFAHLVPGFRNPRLLGPVAFTPDAHPFSMRLNLDKAAVGFALLLLYRPLRRTEGIARSLAVGTAGTVLGIVLVLPLALALGAVGWAPKLPEGLWLWATNNLLLVAFAEEALFRGFLQASLARWLAGVRWGAWIALGVAALAFGVAHYAAGPAMVLLATVAGLAYGLAYRYGGLLASVWAHFLLNLAHILLFTYPLLRHP
jgi:membrane protease YdiL (CAAX protease family)